MGLKPPLWDPEHPKNAKVEKKEREKERKKEREKERKKERGSMSL